MAHEFPEDSVFNETEIERVAARLRRIFVASSVLNILCIGLLVAVAPTWNDMPTMGQVGVPAVLLWSMVVTAYSFYAQLGVSDVIQGKLKDRSFRDEITGAFNYRYLDMRLAEEAERTRRHGGLTSVLYVDLDSFKRVNDDYGHQAGNIVLSQLAALMGQKVRLCDVFGRVGGDEFLVILPQTDRREAYVLAERLRQAVEDYRLDMGDGSAIDFVRLSIGVAAFPVNGETIDSVVTAADNAVYESKAQGGNRASIAGEFIKSETWHDHQIVDRIRDE